MGAPEKTLQSYTALTGRVPLPPKWVFEPWMGRGGGAWAEGHWDDVEFAVAEEESVTKRFRGIGHPAFRDLCRRPLRPFAGIESIHGGARDQGVGLLSSRDSARCSSNRSCRN